MKGLVNLILGLRRSGVFCKRESDKLGNEGPYVGVTGEILRIWDGLDKGKDSSEKGIRNVSTKK